ncbi:hypothetical protein [Nitrococcus mobilis]|uniref:Uncharacterized protein n=1 Tax=Nitrococcus mobilis Nb-231 TaxID=314278 RepID=A4BST4_9GAMM|nr:hypothetical protein [Nitrococcus mobilis]EAR21178.1 hypothetical protein NB231_00615 [Nitrococcus mobilis Nb-231]
MIEEAVERLEVVRLAFLERNWGEEAARAFAARTSRSYRRAVVHHARPPVIGGFGCVYSLPIAS